MAAEWLPLGGSALSGACGPHRLPWRHRLKVQRLKQEGLLAKVKAWLISISLSLGFVTTLGSLLLAAEQKKKALPQTREEFRATFEREIPPENFKGPFLETQRLKQHVNFS